jgi:hypothetical protein
MNGFAGELRAFWNREPIYSLAERPRMALKPFGKPPT